MSRNLLIIMSDEHQARAMGCAGHPFVKTPHLDALAARGTQFSNAITPSPICVPARAAFATGQHVHTIRLWDNAMPYVGAPKGWGHILQDAGIAVESIGKLHYRAEEDPAGFDIEHIPMHVVGGVGMVWASIRKEDERVSPSTRMLGDYIGPGDSKYTQYDAAVTARTVEWLNTAKDRQAPWCLYVGLVAPHFPLVVPEEFYNLYPLDSLPEPKQIAQQHPWVEKQNAFMNSDANFKDEEERKRAQAAYYGLCSYLDHNIGQILEALTAAGLTDQTDIIYTSDHGDNLGARGLWGKSNMYAESLDVPLIAAGPSYEAGQVCDTPASLLDISASIPAHFGQKVPEAFVGGPLKTLAQTNTPDRPLFSQYHAAGAVSGAYMVQQGAWKYIWYEGFEPELFNLRSDPEEMFNLAHDAAHQEQRNSMHELLLNHCNPAQTDKQAFADQAALITHHGGRDAALKLGAPGATPPPKI